VRRLPERAGLGLESLKGTRLVAATSQAGAAGPTKKEAGLRLIILYKLAKAALGLGFAAILWGLVLEGETDKLLDVVEAVRHHVTAAWSLELMDAILSATDRHHVEFLAAALTLDGSFTLFEWYALHTGRPWGEWLVVVATGSLVPFEVGAIVRHKRAGRVVLLLLNIVIVVYLARNALHKHRLAVAKKDELQSETPKTSRS
jgi:uncharacterized membrane protein (DUF2068 family)